MQLQTSELLVLRVERKKGQPLNLRLLVLMMQKGLDVVYGFHSETLAAMG